MKALALIRATEHLALAKAEVETLKMEFGPTAYSQSWSRFLSQVSRFYSKLEQGAKGCDVSTPWFGSKKHQRRTDPLLTYVHHARNCDEHGLDYVIAKTGSQLIVTIKDDAKEVRTSLEMMVDHYGKVHIRNPQTTTPESIENMELTEPRMELVAVKDGRSMRTFDPPKMHLGMPIVECAPPDVAKLTIVYLEGVLDEASKLPVH